MRSYLGICFWALMGFFILTSCASRKKIVYLQNASEDKTPEQTFEPILQPDDLLSIVIMAESPEVAAPFNAPSLNEVGTVNQRNSSLYLIDDRGDIEFPVVGRLHLGGLSRSKAIDKISFAIADYVKNPNISLRILNFKVSVMGEVARPGSYTISGERITLLEALSLAGDLNIQGRRDNILVVREQGGTKSFNRVDITKADFIDTPFYYLKQNDVIVVEPNRVRISEASFGPSIRGLLSIASFMLTLFVLITR
jgi:polysaccharide biosynthesis/export protein